MESSSRNLGPDASTGPPAFSETLGHLSSTQTTFLGTAMSPRLRSVDAKPMSICLILLIGLLSGSTITAQPGDKVFGVEHDWVFHTSNTNSYGIYEYTNYGFRNTILCFGKKSVPVPVRARTLLAIILVLIAGVAGTTAWFMRRRGRLKPVREGAT
jgi:hypothetical protein